MPTTPILTGLFDDARSDGDQSRVASPVGLSAMFCMLAAGTTDRMRARLLTAAGDPNGDPGKMLTMIRDDITAAAGVSAQAVFVRSGIAVKDEWRDQFPGTHYGDLADGAAVDQWVSDATKGMIQRMPVPIMPSTELILADALALIDRWADEYFNVDNTEPGDFRTSSGQTVPAEFMTTLQKRGVLAGDRITGVALSLAGGCRLVAGLPDDPDDDRDAAHLISALIDAEPVSGRPHLWFPRLDLTTRSFNLSHAFDQSGAGDLFADGDWLPGLAGPGPLRIDEARQTALLRLDEKGVEVAAVTAVALTRGISRPDPVIDLRFDRAFPLAIVTPTGNILVAAWVSVPVAT